EYKKLTSELNKLQKEYNQNNSAMAKNESSLNGLKLKMNQTQIEIMQTQKALDKLGDELESSGKKSKDLSKNVEDLKEKFSGVEGAAAKGGAAIAGAMVAGVGALALSANDTVKSLGDLQAKTGATTEQMNDFGEVAKNLYNNGMGDSFKSVTDAMAAVNQTLWLTGDELESTTYNALLLGDTFDADVNDTVKTTNSLMTNFGLNSKEAMTLIAQGFQQGGNASGDLLDTMNEYSVQFSTMGFSAEDFTNILIGGAKSGAFSIDAVGDAVKEFNILSKDGSKTTIEAYQQLGLSADELSAKFAQGGTSGQEAFKDVMISLNGLQDPLQKNQIGVALFGTKWEDLGADAVGALANIGDNANRSADTLDKMNEVKYSNLESAITGISRTLKTELTDTMTTNVLPKLNEFANNIKENMPEIQAKVEGAINIIVPLFEGFVSVIGFVIDNSNWLI
ncbi:MAG: phage tail tape measure protein, partial [Clostridium sp.]